MSLFPAYSSSVPDTAEDSSKTPSWLTNLSYQDFQNKNNETGVGGGNKIGSGVAVEISSDSDLEDPLDAAKAIVISEDDDDIKEVVKMKKKKKKDGKKKKIKTKSRSRSRNHSRSRSTSRNRRRSRSRSRSRKKKRRHSRSRSRSRSNYNRRRRSRSRSRHRKRSRSKSLDNRKALNEDILAKMSSKKIFIEEVGVNWKSAFREDKKGDRTNLGSSGLYARDVAKYKTRMKVPLGKCYQKHIQQEIERNPRFYYKQYIKQIKKIKNVVRINKTTTARSAYDIIHDSRQSYLSINVVNRDEDDGSNIQNRDSSLNPLGVYSSSTVDYLAGVGGLGNGEEDEAVFENDDIELRRIDFNTKLREQPNNIKLWLDFIDFQDEALKETIFESNDDKESKKARKKNGEVLRAKALVERKLAICKSAIEKNTRSIELAVKRLELSRDLFDSKTLDQQWKELIFVYPENLDLWKRYLLFIQTHYIRFSVTDTIKAYKGCVQKLKAQLERGLFEGEDKSKLLELEHGILDIVEAGARLWLQSGHSEKAVALYQALLEFNLFSPDFASSGNYSVDDRLSLFEPIWDSGVRKVGQGGARGWGVELQERVGEGEHSLEEETIVGNQEVEDELLANGGDKANIWLQLEMHRDKEYFFPWRKGEEEPEDPERIVDFDTVLGFLVLLSSQEAKFRLLLSFLNLLGYEVETKPFSNLVNSEAVSKLFNTLERVPEDFEQESVFKRVIPTYKSKESLAIFCHYLFGQTYNKFKEPFRTKIILMWLDFEQEVIKINKSDKSMRKDLKKLVKSLLKEDRNNVELVGKFVEIEYELEGYEAAYSILTTSIAAFNKNFLSQTDEDSLVSSLVLWRIGIEMELREIVNLTQEELTPANLEKDSLHKDKLQWYLVQLGSGSTFKPFSAEKKMSMVALFDTVMDKLSGWIFENMEKVTKIKFSMKAPSVKHSLVEVMFMFAWLLRFSGGWQESFEVIQKFSNQIGTKLKMRKDTRFNEDYLTLKFIQESFDKICFDILWFESKFDVKVKQNLRSFFIHCLHIHPHNGYFLEKFSEVEESNSVVSSVWREAVILVKDKTKVNHMLVQQVLKITLTKFVKVLDPDNPSQLPCVGLGFLNKLHNLLEYLVTLSSVKHNPLVWRLLIWTTSILNNDMDSLKTILYRAIQEVAWCKALYLDTGLYLDKIGQLYRTTRKQVTYNVSGEGDDMEEEEDIEPKYEEIPGSLEHVTELMVEKDLRLRLPLQELDVLLEPVI